MDISRIQSIKHKEKQKNELQHLDETFYQDVRDHLAELYEKRNVAAEQADDPFSCNEVQHLTDDIKTIEEDIKSLYDRRMGKIVKKASFAAADLSADIEGATTEEKEVFESVVAELKANRETVLSTLDVNSTDVTSSTTTPNGTSEGTSGSNQSNTGEVNAGAVSGNSSVTSEPPLDRETGEGGQDNGGGENGDTIDAASIMGGESGGTTKHSNSNEATVHADNSQQGEIAASPNKGSLEFTDESGVDRETVQITADVGEILGVDEKEYDLRENDIVTLPEMNANVLLEKGAAESID